MNIFRSIMALLQSEMERPKIYGLFHIIWLILSLVLVIYFIINKKYSEKKLKIILGVYGIGSFVLELLKQIIWSYDLGTSTWHYNWYAAPFQLCTMPLYISLIALFLKKGKLRDSLLSFVAFIAILGSIATALYPESCFVRTILVDIHTMYLHFGSLVLAIYLKVSGEVDTSFKNLISGFKVFLVLAGIALILNISFYNWGILNGETFNMFYISPYFTSSLPIFDIIYDKVPYILFLIIYLVAIFGGSIIILLIDKLIYKTKLALTIDKC